MKRQELLVSLAGVYLGTPDGGWPETVQAWARLMDAAGTAKAARAAMLSAVERGCRAHPYRPVEREQRAAGEALDAHVRRHPRVTTEQAIWLDEAEGVEL